MNAPFVLIISPGASYRLTPYLNAIKSLLYKAIIASDSDFSIVSADIVGIRIDLGKPDKSLQRIFDAIASVNICAVIATDDATIEMANQVAKQLLLPFNSEAAAKTSHRKDLARLCLSQYKQDHYKIPLFSILPLDRSEQSENQWAQFPAVVKPLSLSGSRGVIRVNQKNELDVALARVGNILHNDQTLAEYERNHVLIEAFIPGVEVAIEGLLQNGKFELITLFDKPDPLDGPYFEESYYITPSRQPEVVQQKIVAATQAVCEAYQLQEGPVHGEFRINQYGVWVLELAARTIGGQCARILQFATGVSLEEMVLKNKLRLPVQYNTDIKGAGILMIPTPGSGILKRVEGLSQASKVENIVDIEITVRQGYELVTLPEGERYLGFIFALAQTPEAVESALREAHQKLKIIIAPLWKIKRL